MLLARADVVLAGNDYGMVRWDNPNANRPGAVRFSVSPAKTTAITPEAPMLSVICSLLEVPDTETRRVAPPEGVH